MRGFLAAPIVHVEAIEMQESYKLLLFWEHRMGACNRLNANIWAHGLFVHGAIVALSITATTVRAE